MARELMYDLVGEFSWTIPQARQCTLSEALYARIGRARAIRKKAKIMAGEIMAGATDDSSAKSELDAATSYPRPPRTVAQKYGSDIAEDLERTRKEQREWLEKHGK